MLAAAPAAAAQAGGRIVAKGRLKQSVCRWCYAKIPAPEFFKAVADMGLTAVDLLTEKDWPIARDHGLICSMGSGFGGSIADGLNVEGESRKDPRRPEARDSDRRGQQGAEPDHVLRQSPRHGRPGGGGELRRGAEPGQRRGRGARRDHLRGAPQQQGRSQGLPGRSLRLGRRDRQGGRLAARQAALRHLPHADHGRRRDPDHPARIRTPSRTSTPAASPAATSSTTRRSSTGGHRARRSPTPASRAISRTSSSRARSADVAAAGRRALRRLTVHQLTSRGGGSGLSTGAFS